MNRNEINNYTKQSSLNVTPSAGVSFSALTLNQHRSKATPSRMSVADAMWLEEEEQFGAVGRVDGEEEEDPFEGDEGEMLPSQCFEPVRDSEGFIRAREVPQLKVSVDLSPVDFISELISNIWLKFGNIVTVEPQSYRTLGETRVVVSLKFL